MSADRPSLDPQIAAIVSGAPPLNSEQNAVLAVLGKVAGGNRDAVQRSGRGAIPARKRKAAA